MIRVDDQSLLEYALGATLYMPATRKTIAQDVISGKLKGLMSMVLCLEDAIGDNEVSEAESMMKQQMQQLALFVSQGSITAADIPLIFVRIRDVEQMWRVTHLLGRDAALLTGFVFPKFTAKNGVLYFEALDKINKCQTKPIYGMPILESPEIMYMESRQNSLLEVKQLLDSYRELVLNVRIGATDFSGLFGLRRSPDMTIYDISVIRSCIDNIINVFTRLDSGYVVSGPVWEFYSSERVLKPLLRQGPFTDNLGQAGEKMRDALLDRYMDGLLHEIVLDKANGLIGKTIIHPSHIKPVQALCVVTHEEYMDACSILAESHGNIGVVSSAYGNKMNEIKPHTRWAQKIMTKSKIYGVFHEQHNFTSLLT
ncbi:HpcH/HpaI aldolase/citrate lyase family protein [Pelosinus fermentans]|uniref:HpcH/HpaI aldolase/citrate lyase family protein n=1 Tax=Pelosinus fermentans TaxID=365349 RepID=UPI00037D276F|nr:HpcH/HpaI aldolase/citrate lyase family protein [Pelosinus fermentans]